MRIKKYYFNFVEKTMVMIKKIEIVKNIDRYRKLQVHGGGGNMK